MAYRAESISWEVALALASFVRLDGRGEEVLKDHDAVVGRDDGGQIHLGLVKQGTAPDTVSVFSAVVEAGQAVRSGNKPYRIQQPPQVIPGSVVRAILAACRERERTGLPAVVGTVGWRRSDAVIVVMMAPPSLAERDSAVIGGATSAGREIHYHVETETYRVIRTTFSR